MPKPTLNKVMKHVTSYGYMKNICRSEERIELNGEIFTPSILVSDILDNFPHDAFSDPEKTFLDPSCGDGQFLCEVLLRKMKNGIDFETSLSTIYGIDIMEDNVALCRERLLCEQNDLVEIVERQIVCADALNYHYRFDGSPAKSIQLDLFGSKEDNLSKICSKLIPAHTNIKNELDQLSPCAI